VNGLPFFDYLSAYRDDIIFGTEQHLQQVPGPYPSTVSDPRSPPSNRSSRTEADRDGVLIGPHCARSMLAGRRAPCELLEGQWEARSSKALMVLLSVSLVQNIQPAVRPLVAARCPAATRDPRHRRGTRVGHLRIRCRSGQRQDMREHAPADRTGGGSRQTAEPSPHEDGSASAGGARAERGAVTVRRPEAPEPSNRCALCPDPHLRPEAGHLYPQMRRMAQSESERYPDWPTKPRRKSPRRLR